MTAQPALRHDEQCDFTVCDNDKGTPIYAVDGARLGRIDHLMIDKASSQVVYAVMRCDGPQGATSERYPLPWSLLVPREGRDGYQAEVTRAELKGAPKYCSNESWDWASRERGQFVHDYYNVPPYWGM